MSWKELLKRKSAKWAVAFCIASILMVIFYLPVFYGEVIEPKQGEFLNDVVLRVFTPMNWSVVIFTLIYISVVQTIFSVARNPAAILLGCATYFAVSILRMGTMYIYTLEPPADMILLIDPISSKFYPNSTFAKDMFFSGHISTMMVLVLVEKNRWARVVKIVFTLAIGLFLAWQHVHYTIDLIVAPMVTFMVFVIIKKILSIDLNS